MIHKNSGSNNGMYGKTGAKNPFYGKKHSKEALIKMSIAHKGKTLSEEHKKKLSESRKGKPKSEEWKSKMRGKNNPNFGKPMSAEQKIKLSIAHKGKCAGKNNPRYGKIASNHSGKGKRSYYISPLQNNVCFKSSYELAYAKYLDSINEPWMYEIETFDIGNNTYTPDFFLPRKELFVEIKGYMSPKAHDKITRFKEQYPWNLEILFEKDLKTMGVL